jgi:hypothetical protein
MPRSNCVASDCAAPRSILAPAPLLRIASPSVLQGTRERQLSGDSVNLGMTRVICGRPSRPLLEPSCTTMVSNVLSLRLREPLHRGLALRILEHGHGTTDHPCRWLHRESMLTCARPVDYRLELVGHPLPRVMRTMDAIPIGLVARKSWSECCPSLPLLTLKRSLQESFRRTPLCGRERTLCGWF